MLFGAGGTAPHTLRLEPHRNHTVKQQFACRTTPRKKSARKRVRRHRLQEPGSAHYLRHVPLTPITSQVALDFAMECACHKSPVPGPYWQLKCFEEHETCQLTGMGPAFVFVRSIKYAKTISVQEKSASRSFPSFDLIWHILCFAHKTNSRVPCS